ncbi:MAG: hypothetical protein EXR52_00950 [Dehalococcoidia bacterium]|nr:hypothetical protein [Dehalococcoidia bacterium]
MGHLLRTATGEVQRLWGEHETGTGAFTKDGRWLTYASGPDTNNLTIHVADLSVWPPITRDLGPGIHPALSPDAALVCLQHWLVRRRRVSGGGEACGAAGNLGSIPGPGVQLVARWALAHRLWPVGRGTTTHPGLRGRYDRLGRQTATLDAALPMR